VVLFHPMGENTILKILVRKSLN